ncbi:MAG: diguanylate cyclase, partial [bacterium]
GADDYMTKPFEIMELTARVAGIMRRNFRALSANPLTLLPGGPTIEEEVNRRIRQKEPFAFLYLDIDNFKAFNDACGYVQGDRVIKAFAGLLAEIAHSAGDSPFVGHIGGDDFVVVSSPGCAEMIAGQAAARFDRLAPSFYSEKDRNRTFITAKDRRGNEQKFPIMTLSISIVTSEKRDLHHYARVADIAAEIKRFLKTMADRKGSIWLQDRRQEAKG